MVGWIGRIITTGGGGGGDDVVGLCTTEFYTSRGMGTQGTRHVTHSTAALGVFFPSEC